MKVIAVVGSGSGVGKTTLACRILAEVGGLAAVKVSPREGPSRIEWGPGEPGKDTARYAASGAVKVARIVGPRESVARTWRRVEPALVGARGAIVEGAGALQCGGERLTLLVISPAQLEARPARSAAILAAADLVVHLGIDPLECQSQPLGRAKESHIGHMRVYSVSSSPTSADEFAVVTRAVAAFLSS